METSTPKLSKSIKFTKKGKSKEPAHRKPGLKQIKSADGETADGGFTLIYSQVLDSEFVKLPEEETQKFVEGNLASL